MITFLKCAFWATLAAATVTLAAWIPALAHAEIPGDQVNVCYALRDGASIVDIEKRLLASGYTDENAGAFAGRMVRDHCPDQIDNVTRQVGFE